MISLRVSLVPTRQWSAPRQILTSRLSGWSMKGQLNNGGLSASGLTLGTKVCQSLSSVKRKLTLQTKGLSYTGLVSPNSFLTGGHLDNFTNHYFQAVNNSIMQRTAWSTGQSASFSPAVEVAVGSPGTRLAIDWTDDQAPTYSLYFQNGSGLIQQQMGMDNGPGVALSGCVVSTSLISNIYLVFCSLLVFWFYS
jgi:hypothetical protein